MTRRGRLIFSFAFLILLCGAAASAGAAEEKERNPAEEAIGQVFKWINFAIVAGAVVYLCVKKGPAFFGGRAEKIGAAIQQAKNTKTSAEEALRAAQASLDRLPSEIASLRAAGESDAAAETERIRALTRAEIAKMHLAAEGEIAAAERAARLALKALGAKLAVDGAESLLVKQLTPQAQEALVNAFVQSLAGRPN